MNNKIYYIEQDVSKNDALKISDLEFSIEVYGKDYYPGTNTLTNTLIYNPVDNYKITVIPKNQVGEIMSGGTLKYKMSTNEQWKVADDLEFIITDITKYDILYEDIYSNTITKRIEVYLDNVFGYIRIK